MRLLRFQVDRFGVLRKRMIAETLGIDVPELASLERAYLESIGGTGYSGQTPVFHCKVVPPQRRQ